MYKKLLILFCAISLLLSACSAPNKEVSPNNSSSNIVNNTQPRALYPVRVDDKFGFIDANGKMVVKPKYNMASDFNDGLGLVLDGDKWGFIDADGKEVIIPQFINQPMDFKNGMTRVMGNDGKAVFINTQGKVVWKAK